MYMTEELIPYSLEYYLGTRGKKIAKDVEDKLKKSSELKAKNKTRRTSTF